jgi:Cft2 family RNA processing exonuclease
MRLHSRLAELDRELSGVVEDDGTAIIPSFAVDRTQSVLFDLHVLFARHPEKFENVDVYLTGYTAKEATQVYHQALKRTLQTRKGKVRPAWLGKQFGELFGLDEYSPANKEVSDAIVDTVFGSEDDPEKLGELLKEYPDTGNQLLESFRRIHTTIDEEHVARKEIQRTDTPSIVLGPSGMCVGGSISYFIHQLAENSSTHILLTGYQASSTEGRELLDLSNLDQEQRQRLTGTLTWPSESPHSKLRLHLSDIRASISKLSSYSGHAGQEALVDYVTEHRTDEPRLLSDDVFLTHGNDQSRETLRDEIHEKTSELRERNPEQAWNVDVRLPREEDTWFDLDDGTWTTPRPGSNTGRPLELEADRRREMKPLEEIARHRDALNELADTLAELKETYPDFDFEGRLTRETPETAYRMRGQFEDIRIELTRLATDEPKALEVDEAKIKELSFVEPLRNTVTREPQPVVAFEAVVEYLRDYLETRLRALQSATQKTDTLRENPGDDTAPTAAE